MLGEVAEGTQPYANGRWRASYPPATTLGNPQLFSLGEIYPLPLPVILEGGWNAKCYATPPPQDVPVEIDIRECDDQTKLADVVATLYQGDGTAAKDKFLGYWPLTTGISWRSNQSDLLPGYVLAVLPNMTVLCLAGTRNFQQWAFQALSALAGPVEFGFYRTNAFWQSLASAMSILVTVYGGDPTKKIVFVGHSLGGAVCCLLAAQYRSWAATRPISLLTFGCPKPGDFRLRAILDQVQQRHFINDQDPVTFVPPSGPDLGQIQWLLPPGQAEIWAGWVRPRNVIGLAFNGAQTDNPSYEGVYNLIYRTVSQAITGRPIETIVAHAMPEYARRVRCPAVPVPSPDPDVVPYLWLQGESLSPYDDGADITYWADSSLFNRPARGQPGDTLLAANFDFPPWPCGARVNQAAMSLKTPLHPSGDFALFIVAEWEGILSLGQRIQPLYSRSTPGGHPAWTANRFGWLDPVTFHFLTVPETRGAIHLFQVRYTPSIMQLWLDRTFIGNLTIALPLSLGVDTWGLSLVSGLPFKRIRLFELLYLEGTIAAADLDQWQADICDFYVIP